MLPMPPLLHPLRVLPLAAMRATTCSATANDPDERLADGRRQPRSLRAVLSFAPSQDVRTTSKPRSFAASSAARTMRSAPRPCRDTCSATGRDRREGTRRTPASSHSRARNHRRALVLGMRHPAVSRTSGALGCAWESFAAGLRRAGVGMLVADGSAVLQAVCVGLAAHIEHVVP